MSQVCLFYSHRWDPPNQKEQSLRTDCQSRMISQIILSQPQQKRESPHFKKEGRRIFACVSQTFGEYYARLSASREKKPGVLTLQTSPFEAVSFVCVLKQGIVADLYVKGEDTCGPAMDHGASQGGFSWFFFAVSPKRGVFDFQKANVLFRAPNTSIAFPPGWRVP